MSSFPKIMKNTSSSVVPKDAKTTSKTTTTTTAATAAAAAAAAATTTTTTTTKHENYGSIDTLLIDSSSSLSSSCCHNSLGGEESEDHDVFLWGSGYGKPYSLTYSCSSCPAGFKKNYVLWIGLIFMLWWGWFASMGLFWIKWSFEPRGFPQDHENDGYDYIVVGAGPAGLLTALELAKRLLMEQESSKRLKGFSSSSKGQGSVHDAVAGKVLLLESGTLSQSSVMNLLLQRNKNVNGKQGLLPKKNKFDVPLFWSELSSKDDLLEYMSHHWPVNQTFLGRAVGGSGIHNAMINIRALPNDFEKWNVTHWSAEEVMPYFRLLEEYDGTIPTILTNYSPPMPNMTVRGSSGLLKTVVGGDMVISPLSGYFISSALSAGLPLATLGFNDPQAKNRIGVGFYEYNIRNGLRDSVAKAVLSPYIDEGGEGGEGKATQSIPSNLIIRTDATVHKVLFETAHATKRKQHDSSNITSPDETSSTLPSLPKAVGVQYYSTQTRSFQQVHLRSSLSNYNSHVGGDDVIKRQRSPQVILSAGAILSSQILANSGISEGGRLVHSPNVGKNLQDHPVVAIAYRIVVSVQDDNSNWLQSIMKSKNIESLSSATERIYGSPGFSVGGFLASPWSQNDVPDIQITVFPHTREPHFVQNEAHGQGGDNDTTNMLVTVALLQPESRNTLQTTSGRAFQSQDENPSVLLDEQSMFKTFESNFKFYSPKIEGGSLTHLDASRIAWGVDQVRNIMSQPPLRDMIEMEIYPGHEYQGEHLIQYVQDNAMRNSHWTGSTRMGDDEESVVDSKLAVRGVESLRIVDAGVMPFIPNGNTHSTTCVVALRAVDLIFN